MLVKKSFISKALLIQLLEITAEQGKFLRHRYSMNTKEFNKGLD